MRLNVAPGVSAVVSLKAFSTLLTTKLSSVLISSEASGSISSHKSTTSSKSPASSGGKSFKSSLRCLTIEFDTILVVVNFPPESEALDGTRYCQHLNTKKKLPSATVLSIITKVLNFILDNHTSSPLGQMQRWSSYVMEGAKDSVERWVKIS
uniref:Uncharacterized protein n=1 Tax=Glossina austeni TaxID=7395 RepID=A0A1A9VBE3_GLOAU